MFELYGFDRMLGVLRSANGSIPVPGIVAIDEVDAHLHPTWQRDIGRWLRRVFPAIQFIITTHSPIVCRAIADGDEIHGSVWRLPAPGSGRSPERITGDDLNQLAFGDILDAYGTELFGENVTISPAGEGKRERLAELNRIALERNLTALEQGQRRDLRALFPAAAAVIS